MVWAHESRECSVIFVGQLVLPELENFEGIYLSNAKNEQERRGVARPNFVTTMTYL